MTNNKWTIEPCPGGFLFDLVRNNDVVWHTGTLTECRDLLDELENREGEQCND